VTSANSAPSKTDEKPFLPPGSATPGIALPNNPIQDANNALPAPLVGTFQGQWELTTNGQINFVNPGVPGTFPAAFTVGADGMLQSYQDSAGHLELVGGAHAISDGNDGAMAWGRWIGGPTAAGVTYPANDPLHYVVGLPLANMPTSGSATYTSYGGTVPSCGGPSCGGTINVTSTLAVNFNGGTPTGSFTMHATNSADGLDVSGGNSLVFVANGAFRNAATAVMHGTGAVSGIALGILEGFLAGPGASHAGAVYNVNYQTAAGGPTGPSTDINGALVYKK
jgi:hypothetical protein